MKAGFKEGAECVARFKIDMFSNNGCMCDFVVFRCNVEILYYCMGMKYKVYLIYDCVCFFVDAYEGVTYAFRILEYVDRED